MTATASSSRLGRIVHLSLMMFLLFFVWGAWFPTVGTFMTKQDMGGLSLNIFGYKMNLIAAAYSCTPVAAIIMPFFMGFFADRFINAEKLQGILMILSGVFIALVPKFASPETPGTFILLLMAHALCFTPTLGLSNTICLKNLADPEGDYPRVRVFATLGWIVATMVFVSLIFKADATATQFYISAVAAFVVGVFSFTLPKTPPPAKGQKVKIGELIGADVFPYFKSLSFSVFMLVSLLGCIGFMTYWVQGGFFPGFLGVERIGAFLSMGQFAELVVLAFILPFFIKKVGIKYTIVLGLAFWVIRYLLMGMSATTGSIPLLAAAVIMHGFCYDFVFVSGFLYIDKAVKEEVRSQAQGLLVVFTQGWGLFLGSQIFTSLHTKVVGSAEGAVAAPLWQKFWFIPAGFLFVLLVVFLILFKSPKPKGDQA